MQLILTTIFVKLFINAIGHYVPAGRIENSYFEALNGLSDEWIMQRTGIRTRSKASKTESTNTMAVDAVKDLKQFMSFPIEEVDLIVGASYSPVDTVFTLAHAVQREFDVRDAQALYVSSACSSFVNALEIVQGYFAMGKATKAIVVAAEHNWYYSQPNDPKAGHLWGDGAVALCITKERLDPSNHEIVDVYTRGLGHIGQANTAVNLTPKDNGIQMDNGRDVFMNACNYMKQALLTVLDRNNLMVDELDYLTGHQANMRILTNVAEAIKITDSNKILSNIEEFGNTGSPSNMIVIAQNKTRFKKGDLIGATVFGGGYSCGAYVIRW